MALLSDTYFLIAITIAIFYITRYLQQRFGLKLLNPLLITIIIMIVFLQFSDIGYEGYQNSSKIIEFWIKPAVVALGVPLYRQLEAIKRQMIPLLLAETAGCVAGIVSVVLIARLLGASEEVVISMVPKAVTMPIALEISGITGGIPALTAAVVVCTGVFGSIAGFQICKLTGVKSPIASSLCVGTASHAVGTSAAVELGERYGAFSSLGLTLNGLLSAALTPWILPLI